MKSEGARWAKMAEWMMDWRWRIEWTANSSNPGAMHGEYVPNRDACRMRVVVVAVVAVVLVEPCAVQVPRMTRPERILSPMLTVDVAVILVLL